MRSAHAELASQGAVGAPPRWERLIEEHRREAEARRQRELDEVAGSRWLRRAVLTLLSLLALLVLTALVWMRLERAIRDDSSRCSAVSGAVEAKVGVGGWGAPDTCSYVDAQGALVHRDAAQYAGPVTKSYPAVASDHLATLGVIAVIVTAAGVIAVAQWRSR